jgi:hypothetical protein
LLLRDAALPDRDLLEALLRLLADLADPERLLDFRLLRDALLAPLFDLDRLFLDCLDCLEPLLDLDPERLFLDCLEPLLERLESLLGVLDLDLDVLAGLPLFDLDFLSILRERDRDLDSLVLSVSFRPGDLERLLESLDCLDATETLLDLDFRTGETLRDLSFAISSSDVSNGLSAAVVSWDSTSKIKEDTT